MKMRMRTSKQMKMKMTTRQRMMIMRTRYMHKITKTKIMVKIVLRVKTKIIRMILLTVVKDYDWRS